MLGEESGSSQVEPAVPAKAAAKKPRKAAKRGRTLVRELTATELRFREAFTEEFPGQTFPEDVGSDVEVVSASDVPANVVSVMPAHLRTTSVDAVTRVLRSMSGSPVAAHEDIPEGRPLRRTFRRDTPIGMAQINMVTSDPRIRLVRMTSDMWNDQPVAEAQFYLLAPIEETNLLDINQIVPMEQLRTKDKKAELVCPPALQAQAATAPDEAILARLSTRQYAALPLDGDDTE